jgi:hypothetical protein
MKFERPIKRSVVAWADQTGYPSDLVSGSPEHGGAHEHLLSLAVEMESDFEPRSKRTRDEEPSADCSRGPVTMRFSPRRWARTGASA